MYLRRITYTSIHLRDTFDLQEIKRAFVCFRVLHKINDKKMKLLFKSYHTVQLNLIHENHHNICNKCYKYVISLQSRF